VTKLEDLRKQIEDLRSNMLKIKEGKTFTHPQVIAASQALDIVINEHHKMMKRT